MTVSIISECNIRPHPPLPEQPRRQQQQQLLPLTPWDLALLSVHYIQFGLLFYMPHQQDPVAVFVDRLKHSLARALAHFFPLAGRLVTQKADDDEDDTSSSVFINCHAAGAEFVHAASGDIYVADLLTTNTDVHPVMEGFFPLNQVIGLDGHSLPVLAAQLTQLRDGFFLALSFSHVVGDGTSFWNFFNSWAEICRTGKSDISCPPVIKPWFPPTAVPPIRLPFSNPADMIEERYDPPPLRVRCFHLSSESVARLKARANEDCKTDKISSFQALSAHVWRSITRARRFPTDQTVIYRFPVNFRSRLQPPQPDDYFGNLYQGINVHAKASELGANNLGWAAWLVHHAVVIRTDGSIRASFEAWVKAPVIGSLSQMGDGRHICMGNSPRFDVYGADFGWGKAVAARPGPGNKFDGMLFAFPGREGGGSVDIHMSLSPETMAVLESDEEYMDYVSEDW